MLILDFTDIYIYIWRVLIHSHCKKNIQTMGSQLKDPCAFPQFAIKAPAISQDAFPSGGSRRGALESLGLPLILGKKRRKDRREKSQQGE